jgi:hypothetical protein
MAESTLSTGADTYSSAIETADDLARWVLDRFRPSFGWRFFGASRTLVVCKS